MLARVIGFKVPPERLEEVENAYRTSLLPEMEGHRGFASMLVFRNEDSNEVLEVTLWVDEAARLESEREGGFLSGRRTRWRP